MSKKSYKKQELSCLQRAVHRWQRQQQKNTLKICSDAVAMSSKKKLPKLSSMITTCCEHLIFG